MDRQNLMKTIEDCAESLDLMERMLLIEQRQKNRQQDIGARKEQEKKRMMKCCFPKEIQPAALCWTKKTHKGKIWWTIWFKILTQMAQ